MELGKHPWQGRVLCRKEEQHVGKKHGCMDPNDVFRELGVTLFEVMQEVMREETA